MYVKPCKGEEHEMVRITTNFDLTTDTLIIHEYCKKCGTNIYSEIWQDEIEDEEE